MEEKIEDLRQALDKLSDEVSKDLVVILADYDAFSLVPDLAPGAVNALNTGLALELARKIKAAEQQRNVMFVFTSGNAQRYRGIREFLWTVRQKQKRKFLLVGKDLSPSTVVRACEKELEDIGILIEALRKEKKPFAGIEDTFPLVQSLKYEAGRWSDRLTKQIGRLRLKPEEQRTAGDDKKIRKMSDMLTAINSVRLMVPNFGWEDRLAEINKKLKSSREKVVKRAGSDLRILKREKAVFRKLQNMALNTNEKRRDELEFKLYEHKKDVNIARIVDSELISNIFFFELRLSPGNDRFGLFYQGYLNEVSSKSGVFDVVKKINTRMKEAFPKSDVFEDNTIIGTRNWKDFIPFKLTFAIEDCVTHGFYGLSAVTIDDFRKFEVTPSDTLENAELKNFFRQAEQVDDVVSILVSEKDILYKSHSAQVGFISGNIVAVSGTSAVPKSGVSKAVVLCRPVNTGGNLDDKKFGILDSQVLISDTFGGYQVPGLKARTSYLCEPFVYDDNGLLVKVPDSCGEAPGGSTVKTSIAGKENVIKTVVFEGVGVSICGLFDPLYFQYMDTAKPISSIRNSAPPRYYVATQDGVAACFIPATNIKDRIKIVASRGAFDNHLLLLNNDWLNPYGKTKNDIPRARGKGYDPNGSFDEFVPLEVAANMWGLDEYRIENLRKRNVTSKFLDELHKKARNKIEKAYEYYEDKEYKKAYTEAMDAWAYERRVYPGVIKTSNDVVHAVIILLLMSIPFAFVLERLFIGSRNIYTRITSFLIIFGIIFAILYTVHPAFQLTMTPLIIILAFALLTDRKSVV